MTSPLNATPQSILLGIDDQSTVALVAEAEQLPTHLPKLYFYAKKGPTEPQLVVGNSRSIMYGVDSFDLRKPWANHATVLANLINAQGNAGMYERVKPADAGPNASIRVSIDVLPMAVPLYQRNSDGSIKVDAQNSPVPMEDGSTTTGYKVKFIGEPIEYLAPEEEGGEPISTYGLGEEGAGDQVDEQSQTTSVRYPLFDTETPDFGADGNLRGIRLWAPTTKSSNPIDPTLLTQNKVYPLRMSCVLKDSAESTPTTKPTTSAEQYVDIGFVPGAINKRTDKITFVEEVFVQSYQNLEDPSVPPVWGPFGKFHLYQENVDKLVKLFYAAEKPHSIGSVDFDQSEGEEYRFNFIGGTDSQGVPYQSYIFSKDAGSVRLTENSTIYASGGSDGTMNDVEFAKLVSASVKKYADVDSEFQNTAKYPESMIWDSGYPLETKYDLISFIANRKDTGVGLCTHTVGGPELTASEESALAVALRTRLGMFPESETFGTSVVRGIVVGRSGKLINSQFTQPLPLILEIASKTAQYMGAGNGKWKSGQSFDKAPRSKVTMFRDINVTFTPFTVRNKDWANGLNWVESFDRRSFSFPALKTAYDNDTSVLTSFFTMMGCIEVEKVADRCWREFRGVDTLSNAQIIKQVNQFFNDNLVGRFDNRFTINPEAYFTAQDIARGYSYSVRVKVYANNMKTVQTMVLEAHRIEDLAA